MIPKEITPAEAAALLKSGALLVDVRSSSTAVAAGERR
jgi:hypothetical protein